MPDGAARDFESLALPAARAPAFERIAALVLPPRATMRGFDDRLFRVLLRGLARGVLAGLTALAAVLWTDVGGIGAKALGGAHGWLPLTMMAWAFAITFGSAGMGIAIHRLGRPG